MPRGVDLNIFRSTLTGGQEVSECVASVDWDKAREFCEAGADLSEWGFRVSARVKYSGGGGGMGSKAYTISKGSIAYHAPRLIIPA